MRTARMVAGDGVSPMARATTRTAAAVLHRTDNQYDHSGNDHFLSLFETEVDSRN
jgi:hypothetical protein